MRPPPLPAKVLARVLRVATIDGRIVLFLAGSIALFSAMGGDWFGAIIGSLIAGAGAVELHGVGLLRNGEVRGLNWLVRSQLLLLNLILAYVAIQVILLHRNGLNGILSQGTVDELKELGVGANDVGRSVVEMVRSAYAAVAALTLLFQGGMALYYHRRRAVVRQALELAPPKVEVRARGVPKPPEKVLARVLLVARFEGLTVLMLAGGIALLSAMFGDWYGAIVGSLVAGAGAVELHGAGLLRSGEVRGLNWLVRSQLLLATIILVYAAIQLLTLHFLGLKGLFSVSFMDELPATAQGAGMSVKDLGLMMVHVTQVFYAVLAGLTLLYQGGMARYYSRRREMIRQALEQAGAGDGGQAG